MIRFTLLLTAAIAAPVLSQAPAARSTTAHAMAATTPAARTTTHMTTAAPAHTATATTAAATTHRTTTTRPAAPAGRMVSVKLSNGRTVTYNCSLPGNANKQACKK